MFVWILGGKKSLIHDIIYVLKPNIVVVNIANNRKFKITHFMELLKKEKLKSYLVNHRWRGTVIEHLSQRVRSNQRFANYETELATDVS